MNEKYITSEGKVLFIDLMITSVLIVYSGHEYWVYTVYIFTLCSLREEISSNEINIVIRAASDSIVASRLAATSQTTIVLAI